MPPKINKATQEDKNAVVPDEDGNTHGYDEDEEEDDENENADMDDRSRPP